MEKTAGIQLTTHQIKIMQEKAKAKQQKHLERIPELLILLAGEVRPDFPQFQKNPPETQNLEKGILRPLEQIMETVVAE